MPISTCQREQINAKIRLSEGAQGAADRERHVRNAIARFDQVEGVSDSEREAAWRRIRAAARKFASRSRQKAGARS